MTTYILRRLLLMIPTLFGITVMVFLIARLAPGRPGTTAVGAGQVSAEEQKALREWYEEKYGLDLPLWKQYGRWWMSMVTAQTQATAWTDENPPREIFTLTRAVPEYFAPLPDGSWLRVASPVQIGEVFAQSDPAFAAIASGAAGALPEVEEGYIEPRHAVAEAGLEELAAPLPMDRLEPVRRMDVANVDREVPALADFGSGDGVLLYRDPDDDARGLYRRGGLWFALQPQRQRVLSIDDPALTRTMRAAGMDIKEERDEFALPRAALISGESRRIDPPADQDALQPFTIVARNIAVPTMVWVSVPNSPGRVPLFEQIEPLPMLLVRDSSAPSGWKRLIGPSYVEQPEMIEFEQSDETLLARLSPVHRDALPSAEDARREPMHVLMRGHFVDVDLPITDRDIRRHSHQLELFEITLGESRTSHTSVIDEIKQRLPVTLMISFIAFPLIYLIAIPCGMLMAVKRGRRFDTGANVVLLGFWSIPTVLSATLLIGYVASGGKGVEWFPSNGLSSVGAEGLPFTQWLGDRLWHLVLPVLCIVYGGFAYLAKQMRAAMLDNFTMDYVRTARAKGVPYKHIVFRHVLRNSLLPIITIFATLLPVLIAGSIIIEKIFNIEGMGLFTFRAVQNRDYDVVQAMALIAGVLNLTGLLLADIAYAIADPRIAFR